MPATTRYFPSKAYTPPMPCRPATCQRLAAHLCSRRPSSDHIWISDDILSEAFARFMRVSHTQRRYGSNVPGPLEARRRTARRRMGCAVAGGGGMPPPPDVGQLFGSSGVGKARGGWSWEAPATKGKEMSEDDGGVGVALWGWGGRPPERIGEVVEESNEVEEEVDVVEESKAAFERLLGTFTGGGPLETSDLETYLEFLTSSADEPEAGNTIRLIEWAAKYSITAGALSSISTLIVDKIELGTIPMQEVWVVLHALPKTVDREHVACCGELHDAYAAIWNARTDAGVDFNTCPNFLKLVGLNAREPQHCELMFDIFFKYAASCWKGLRSATVADGLLVMLRLLLLKKPNPDERKDRVEKVAGLLSRLDQIQPSRSKVWIQATTKQICNAVMLEDRRAVVLFWLECLRKSLPMQDYGEAWRAIYTCLAPHFRPSDLAEHFKEMDSFHFAKVLLDDWLPFADLEAFTPEGDLSFGDAGQFTRLRYKSSKLTIQDLPQIRAHFEAMTGLDKKYDNHPLAKLLIAFKHHRIAYHGIALEILRTCHAMYPPARLHNTYSKIFFSPELDTPKDLSIFMMRHFLSISRPTRALEIFRLASSVTISDCPDLAISLFTQVNTNADVLYDLLARQPTRVPQYLRSVNRLTCTPEHINIVHIIAHKLAHSPHTTARTAYRRVWTCYRFLQDRGAPCTPLLSRALVHAGIVRPAQLELPIPIGRVEFITARVRQLEGDGVAEQVDRLSYFIRRRGLMTREREVKTEKLRMRWQKRTKRLLERAQWRLKGWTKERPLLRENWGESSAGFEVPGSTSTDGSFGEMRLILDDGAEPGIAKEEGKDGVACAAPAPSQQAGPYDPEDFFAAHARLQPLSSPQQVYSYRLRARATYPQRRSYSTTGEGFKTTQQTPTRQHKSLNDHFESFSHDNGQDQAEDTARVTKTSDEVAVEAGQQALRQEQKGYSSDGQLENQPQNNATAMKASKPPKWGGAFRKLSPERSDLFWKAAQPSGPEFDRMPSPLSKEQDGERRFGLLKENARIRLRAAHEYEVLPQFRVRKHATKDDDEHLRRLEVRRARTQGRHFGGAEPGTPNDEPQQFRVRKHVRAIDKPEARKAAGHKSRASSAENRVPAALADDDDQGQSPPTSVRKIGMGFTIIRKVDTQRYEPRILERMMSQERNEERYAQRTAALAEAVNDVLNMEGLGMGGMGQDRRERREDGEGLVQGMLPMVEEGERTPWGFRKEVGKGKAGGSGGEEE